MTELVQTVIFGLATGGIIGVAALGLTLSFGVTGFINFAFGELLTIAAYTTWATNAAGLPLGLAIVAALVVTAVSAVLVAVLFYDPLRGRSPMALLITSIGVGFVLQNAIRMGFGASPEPFPIPLLGPWWVGDVFLPKVQVGILAFALVAMVGLHLLLRHTLLGRRMRATAENDALARLSGISTQRTVRVTWLVSGVLAGGAGVMLGATETNITATMGFAFLPAVFAATILGGIGQPYGAMAAAVIVGLGMELGATYVSADYTLVFAFAALVVALLFRPEGLFATGATR